MLKAAKESIPKKRASRWNKPFWDEELQKARKDRDGLRKEGGERISQWINKNEELRKMVKQKKKLYWKRFV